MDYSFVIPCYNSELTITNVVEDIIKVMDLKTKKDFEIIMVNDCSKDGTANVINNLAKNYENVQSYNLAKNFGQHSALLAGYNQSCGKLVISLDDDGQTPACEVFKLIDKIHEGYDVVFAKYPSKKHSFYRNLGSKFNDKMACVMIEKPKDISISSYFIAKKFVIDEMVKYKNPYPYISGLVLRTTNSIANVDVDHRERTIGDSGYSFKKLIALWINGFTAFSVKPLRISMIVGLVFAIMGFGLTFYSVVNYFLNPLVPMGWTSMVAAVSSIGGVILIVMGMIGEYIGRIYISLNNSPQYVFRDEDTNVE